MGWKVQKIALLVCLGYDEKGDIRSFHQEKSPLCRSDLCGAILSFLTGGSL